MSTPAQSILREYIEARNIKGLMQKSDALRCALWSPLVRVVLSVRDKNDVDQGEIKWNELPLGDLTAPVTREEVLAWMSPERPYQAVQKLASLCDGMLAPQPVSLEDLICAAKERAPVHLSRILPNPSFCSQPNLRARYELAGEALGKGLAESKSSIHSLVAGQLQYGTIEAIGAYLREGLELLNPFDLVDLGKHIPQDAPAAVREAYGEACVVAIKRVKKSDAYRFRIRITPLSAEQIEAMLRAMRTKGEVFTSVARYVAVQGEPQGAGALSLLLGDQKVGLESARWLSAMGAEGKRAAATWREQKGKAAERAKPLAEKILALPDAPSAFAGYQYGFPRFGLDISRYLLSDAPLTESPAAEPSTLESLDKAFSETLRQDALDARGWADALQLISLDKRLQAVADAYEYANTQRLLGRGNEEASLVKALDRLDWHANVTRAYYGNKAKIGHILLWAGASKDVFLHAVARFWLNVRVKTLGIYDEQFGNALKELSPAWADEVQSLLRHLEFSDRDTRPFLGPPREIASFSAEGGTHASATLEGPFGDAWIRGSARGATRIRVRVRSGAALEIDAISRRWKVTGLGRSDAEGAIVPATGDELGFVIEMHKDRMIVGVEGAIVTSTLEGLPRQAGPVCVECEGEGATIQKLTVYEKHAQTLGEAAAQALTKPNDAQAIDEVAALGTRAAAHVLATIAWLAPEGEQGFAREALAEMGEVADKFRAALGLEAAPRGSRFTLRSWDEVVRDYTALWPKKKLKTGEIYGKKAVSTGNIESPGYKRGEAVPHPTIYLSSSSDELCEDPIALVDEISGLPALTKGWGSSARVSATKSAGEYVIASLTIDAGDYDDALFYEALCAMWKVDEGTAIAVWDEGRRGLAAVMGMKSLPTELEWYDVEGNVPIGE